MSARLAMLALCAGAACADDGRLAPVVIPARPSPYFSWERLPMAFHGANQTGEYSAEAVALMAKYQMVTIEKWYTACAAMRPDRSQGGPACAVEAKVEKVLGEVGALNPNTTRVLYLNSLFNFAFYELNGRMLEAEAAGKESFLRDRHGEVVYLCNDGNGYCNITTFDWTKPHVRDLWMEAVSNATATGNVEGIFADHSAQEQYNIGTPTQGQTPLEMCNGRGALKKCYEFTADFKESFNSWHTWSTNKSQDVLAKTTGGPVICGSYAMWNVRCDFDAIREAQKTHNVVEVKDGCAPSPKCLAAYLTAAEEGTYLSCFMDAPQHFPEMDYTLGAPDGPAEERAAGVYRRRFASGTVAWWDNNKKTGNVTWGGRA
eukprot:TRINITY_DN2063_c0_g1_i2.p1 TRINITY_DN2063_c0_g1~~TRINITY_DN2063_c0_g1_i2.p1  ORF type:complete len:374 (+),score=174.76 TRINITY_DN2063_c0_g1_i2:60-1181(+)